MGSAELTIGSGYSRFNARVRPCRCQYGRRPPAAPTRFSNVRPKARSSDGACAWRQPFPGFQSRPAQDAGALALASFVQMVPRKSGSQWTRRWSEADSNSQSLSREHPAKEGLNKELRIDLRHCRPRDSVKLGGSTPSPAYYASANPRNPRIGMSLANDAT
jgi:hypothetical protein